MPLENAPVGSPGFGRNVATEVKAGKPESQAVAIAYSKAGEKHDSSGLLNNRIRGDIAAILDSCAALDRRLARLETK